ncbi:MAG: very short patch repair endonuclease [Rhizobium rhizophilum]|uniref:very short patch repair endonuclease n=1 Tax=Rhizobium rhizophilum TaxID=1850373 RepID=UPI00391AC377
MKPPPAIDGRRSALMGRVRQRGTKPEASVARLLRDLDISYRLNVKSLPGSPDFANRHRRFALFVNGCFWHHHTGCSKAGLPKHNASFWADKFSTNRRRDAAAIRKLRRSGFRVLLIWECETVDPDRLRLRLSKVLETRGVDMGQPIDH